MLRLILAILLIPSVCIAASVDKSINGLTTETSIASDDYVPFWDTSAAKTRKLPMGSVFYAPSGVSIISSAYPLSGASVSIANSLYIASGATFYRSGGTATVYFYGDIQAGNYPWIDESSVSAYFMPGSVKEINPMWWGAKGSDTVDDTIAIRAAGRSLYPASTTVSGWYIYSYPEIVFPAGHYYISSGVTIGSASASVRGSDHAIIEQTTPTEDILVWGYGYNVDVSNLTFIGGRRQIAYSNPNLGPVEIRLNNVKFTHNNSDAALKFYTTAGSTQLSGTATLTGCMFKDTYQCAETVLGLSFRFNDGWVYTGGVTNTNRALFVNKSDMALTGMYGVPNAIITPTGGRWIDNYSDLMIDRCRFGSEGSGMPIVYNYDVTVPRTDHVGGGKVSIRNSALACGDTTVDNTIIRLMTGIPQNITIRDNDWIVKSAGTPFIVPDTAFDIETYINALNVADYVFIDVGNNASYIPLEMLGLPTSLVNTDKGKVRVSSNFKPYVPGYSKTALLHFDGVLSGTTIIDEYFGSWTAGAGASLYTTRKRFGSASMQFNGAAGYVYSNNFTSLGSAFTAEGWFYSGTTTEPFQTLFQGVDGATGYGAVLYYDGTVGVAALKLYVSSNNAAWDVANATLGAKTTWLENTWYKWALEFTGSEYAVYVGEAGSAVTKDISVTSGSSPCAITTIRLGGDSAAGGLMGGMDEFRLTIGDYRYGGVFVPESVAFKPED